MTSDEQIFGVMQVIDYVQSVSMSGVPVTVERTRFEKYLDYESILEKLDRDMKVISIKAYPLMEDVDYHANVGFMDDAVLKKAISYDIELLPNFEESLHSYRELTTTKDDKSARIGMSGNKVVLTYSDGEVREIKSLRIDSATYNFMYYVLAHPDRPITRTTIQTSVDGCKTRNDMTELVRDCGFNKKLKSYFFNGTTKDKVIFSTHADVPREIVEKSS